MSGNWPTIARLAGTSLLVGVFSVCLGLIFSISRDGEKIAAILMVIGICALLATLTLGAFLGLHMLWS